MNRTATIMAGIVIATGSAQAQEVQTQEPEQERPADAFDESVRTEREERPVTESEREYDAKDEYNDPFTQRERNPTAIEDQYDRRADDPETNIDDPYRADAVQQEAPTGAAPASTANLPGMTIITAQGEEVGTIEQVGYSRQHDERVATVNIGGFLGAGEKVIAIPLSELGLDGEDEFVTTSMDRTALETAREFDPSQLVTAERPRSPQPLE